MRTKPLSYLLAWMLAVPLSCQAEDLMDVLQQALANDPQLSAADASRRSSDQEVPIARAGLLPQATLEHSFSQTADGVRDVNQQGQQRTRQLIGSLTQSVFDLSTLATLRQAKASAAAGQEIYRAELLQLYVRAAQAYFNVLLMQDQLQTYNAYEDAYRRNYEQTNTRYAEGLSAQVDMNQAHAYYLLSKSQRISVENSLQQAQQALTQITAREPGELRKLREDFPMQLPVPADVQSWVAQALQLNPSVQSEGHALRAAEHAISAARAGHLPTLQANVGYSKSGSWYSGSPSDPSNAPGETVVGLTMNFPLFSGGAVRAQVRQAVADRDVAAGTLESERRQVEYDVRSYYQQLVQGVAQVEAARAAVQASQQSLQSMQVGYEIGTQDLTNLVLAIGNLADSQSQYTSVRHQYVLSLLLLKQAAGVLEVEDLQEVNRWLQ
jgi:outer membrane protein